MQVERRPFSGASPLTKGFPPRKKGVTTPTVWLLGGRKKKFISLLVGRPASGAFFQVFSRGGKSPRKRRLKNGQNKSEKKKGPMFSRRKRAHLRHAPRWEGA